MKQISLDVFEMGYITSVEHLQCPEWDRWKLPGVDYDRNIINNTL